MPCGKGGRITFAPVHSVVRLLALDQLESSSPSHAVGGGCCCKIVNFFIVCFFPSDAPRGLKELDNLVQGPYSSVRGTSRALPDNPSHELFIGAGIYPIEMIYTYLENKKQNSTPYVRGQNPVLFSLLCRQFDFLGGCPLSEKLSRRSILEACLISLELSQTQLIFEIQHRTHMYWIRTIAPQLVSGGCLYSRGVVRTIDFWRLVLINRTYLPRK